MKKIRIWLNSFSLLQQFIAITFLTVFFFLVFVFAFLRNNIHEMIDKQMYLYLNKAQNEYILKDHLNESYVDDNVVHFLYSINSHNYLNTIESDYRKYLDEVVFDNENDEGLIHEDNRHIVYAIKDFNQYKLVSFINDEYRKSFEQEVMNNIINITLSCVFILYAFFMLWVVSLIRPLNKIRAYINYIKTNSGIKKLKFRRKDEIGEVVEALSSMQEELQKQEHIREEMVQNISHDLKTPIAIIKSYSESIKDGIYPYDTLEKSIDVILEHANRLEKKVYSLITYNKMGYLVDNSDGDDLKMAPIIQKVILSSEVLRADIEIRTSLDDTVFFHGEEEPWRIVIENLLDNALRYATSMVKITLKKDFLEIYNNGELMDKDRLDKLFKPYEKGTKGNFGLGLSIVKKISEVYGYSVVGENKDDGVVFRIYR